MERAGEAEAKMSGSTVGLGVSAAMREVSNDIALAAQSSARVLITGENGVGKTALARIIHERGARASRGFITVPCEGTSDWSLGAGLFGQVSKQMGERRQGAFEDADGGTLFLDEVGDLSTGIQARLVRFIDTGEIQPIASDRCLPPLDVRIVAATSQPLSSVVESGRFREDLFYRLNVIHIVVPPLRHRREDVIPLLKARLARTAAQAGLRAPELADGLAERLTHYHWPGNVRQLHLVADALVRRGQHRQIEASDLPDEIAAPRPAPRPEILRSSRRLVQHAHRFAGGVLRPLTLQRVRAH
jgi:transcriptional regulator of aroF, aroG, tyrA and aromatic amino acid transport